MSRKRIGSVLVSLGVLWGIGAMTTPSQAIELFTNFNNGEELGTRPIGYDPMGPVRYHAYPHRWRWMAQRGEVAGPAGGAPYAAGATATPNRNATTVTAQPVKGPDAEDQWIRSSSFMPTGAPRER